MNRSEGNIFTKNNNSIEGVFEFMFIYTGKIVGVLGQEQPLIKKTVSVELEKLRKDYFLRDVNKPKNFSKDD